MVVTVCGLGVSLLVEYLHVTLRDWVRVSILQQQFVYESCCV